MEKIACDRCRQATTIPTDHYVKIRDDVESLCAKCLNSCRCLLARWQKDMCPQCKNMRYGSNDRVVKLDMRLYFLCADCWDEFDDWWRSGSREQEDGLSGN